MKKKNTLNEIDDSNIKEEKFLTIKDIIWFITIIIVVVLIRSFIATPVLVSGSSMVPTLTNKELLILKKYDKSYQRYDIVVLNYNNEKLIKRVIGLPGETVEYKDGKLYINGEEVEDEFASITSNFKMDELGIKKVPEDCYFVMGDNRNNSIDSRMIGVISKDNIDGKTNFSLWPFSSFGKIE